MAIDPFSMFASMINRSNCVYWRKIRFDFGLDSNVKEGVNRPLPAPG